VPPPYTIIYYSRYITASGLGSGWRLTSDCPEILAIRFNSVADDEARRRAKANVPPLVLILNGYISGMGSGWRLTVREVLLRIWALRLAVTAARLSRRRWGIYYLVTCVLDVTR
jgi:hypothetical protein